MNKQDEETLQFFALGKVAQEFPVEGDHCWNVLIALKVCCRIVQKEGVLFLWRAVDAGDASLQVRPAPAPRVEEGEELLLPGIAVVDEKIEERIAFAGRGCE